MARITRRSFVKSSAAASTAFGLFTIAGTKSSGRVLGANDMIRVGVAGIHGRGQSHIDGFGKELKDQNVQVTYLIDPDTRWFDSRKSTVAGFGGGDPKCVKDIREALDDKNLDVVTVATCNHWHSLITIWACQAGKDVYVEKPISHNVFEGRKCVEAAAKYGRVVQHGTQQRSSLERAREIAAVQSGKYGKLLVSKGYCCKPRWSIGTKPLGAPPAELDFNIWLGPALEQSYHANLVPYNWHWFWDTGNGDIGNQGVHEMDVARWAIKDATLPEQRVEPGRTIRISGSRPDAQHADGRLRIRRRAAGVRSSRTGRQRNEAAEQGLERVLHHRGRHPRRQVLSQRLDRGREGRRARGPRHAGRNVWQLHSRGAQPQA